MGVFLFVGPTGVGKTELAKALAAFFPLRGGAFKEQLGAIAMGAKVEIEIASLRGGPPTSSSSNVQLAAVRPEEQRQV